MGKDKSVAFGPSAFQTSAVGGCLALGFDFGLARRGLEVETPGVQGVRPRAPSP